LTCHGVSWKIIYFIVREKRLPLYKGVFSPFMMVGNLGIEGVLPLGYIVHHAGKLNGRLEVLLLVYVRLYVCITFHMLLILVKNPCRMS
jgi:hypothetical protein